MYLHTEPIGTTYRNSPGYVYQCDGCTARYTFPVPQDAPFRCNSPACNWSTIRIDGEQPFRFAQAVTVPVQRCRCDVCIGLYRGDN